MDILEVSDDGTLTVPAEALGGAAPKTRYRAVPHGQGLLLEQEQAAPEGTADEWWDRFHQYSEAVSRAWASDQSAAEIVAEMRR